MNMIDDIESYLGKTVLANITVYDPRSSAIEDVQIHGTITAFEGPSIVVIEQAHGVGPFRAPFSESAMHPAEPGDYHLWHKGYTASNPDFLLAMVHELAEDQSMESLRRSGLQLAEKPAQ